MTGPETGIEAIGLHIPASGRDVLDRLGEFDLDAAFVRDKTGFVRTARLDEGQDTSDLAVAACRDLETRHGVDLNGVDCLVVVTQTPDRGGIPHTSAIVQHKLGLASHVACFDIGLACSGYVYGLSVIRAFMAANGIQRGLLVTADPYSKVMDEGDRNTAILFGDGAAATLIGPDPVWRIGQMSFGTKGSGNRAITLDETGMLSMNGRAVFTFCASAVPPAIRAHLDKTGLTLPDLDRVLLHQGSRYIVDAIRTALDLPPQVVPFGAAETGNTVSSSLPLLLAECDPARLGHVLLCGFGAGMSWGTTLLTSTVAKGPTR